MLKIPAILKCIEEGFPFRLGMMRMLRPGMTTKERPTKKNNDKSPTKRDGTNATPKL
ncbi:MAG: hypothetical protein ACI4UJ_07620 [Candidatus Cryptobacteroides sp.]